MQIIIAFCFLLCLPLVMFVIIRTSENADRKRMEKEFERRKQIAEKVVSLYENNKRIIYCVRTIFPLYEKCEVQFYDDKVYEINFAMDEGSLEGLNKFITDNYSEEL